MFTLINRILWYVSILVILNIKNSYGSDVEGLENHSVFYGVCLLAKLNNLNIVSTCLEQLSSVGSGIQRRDRWALKLLDASGAPETKLHWGNRFWLGSRRQCHAGAEIRKIPVSPSPRSFTETNETISPFPVEYYAIYFHHNSTIQGAINSDVYEFIINMGLCLPSSCTEQEVYSLVQEYLNSNKLSIQRLYAMEFKMDSVKKMRNDYSWMSERRFKVFIYSIGFTILLSIFATLYDIGFGRNNYEHHGHEPLNNEADRNTNGQPPKHLYEKFIQSFSLYKNAKTLFDTSVREESGNFKPMFGLRFFLSSGIIMFHTVYHTGDATYNTVSGVIATEGGLMDVYSSAPFLVDSFFTLSGFLMGYSFLDMERKRIESKAPEPNIMKKIFLIIFRILSRFLRLTPTYMVALGFTEFLTKWRHTETFYCEKDATKVFPCYVPDKK